MKAVLMNRREREVLIRALSLRAPHTIVLRFNDTIAIDEQLSVRINYARNEATFFSIYFQYIDTINIL